MSKRKSKRKTNVEVVDQETGAFERPKVTLFTTAPEGYDLSAVDWGNCILWDEDTARENAEENGYRLVRVELRVESAEVEQ